MSEPLLVAAVYGRVSTPEQSTAPQLELLLAEARRLGFQVPPDRIYADDGVSGSLESRPAFDRLRTAIGNREVSAIFVTKLDRLGRSVKGLLEFYDLAENAGVRVIVTDQAIDTGTAVGRLVRTVLAGMAEFERDLIVDRTQTRMDAIKGGMPTRSGRPVGRPRRVTPEKVAAARELRSTTPPTTWSAVAQRVGLPAETLRKAVRAASRLPAPAGRAGTIDTNQ
jgi:DNA invertase Pin-like site-specific DNA recombinase